MAAGAVISGGTASGAPAVGDTVVQFDFGSDSSLVLDASGFPVISYYDAPVDIDEGRGVGDLKLLHCNDPGCAGGDDVPVVVDGRGDAGEAPTLLLDASGLPVILYSARSGLHLVRCNDANCAGGDEQPVAIVDRNFEPTSSLALDSAGFPVITYYDDEYIHVLHCNDPSCRGDDDVAHPIEWGGFEPSLALDREGFPVITYTVERAVRMLRCNDPDCAGGDDVPVTIDDRNSVQASLALDASGFPVVAYYDISAFELRLVHCNDPVCGGGDDVPVVINVGSSGAHPSLVLDASGFPVVAYYESDDDDFEVYDGYLAVVHCNDPGCLGGDDVPAVVDDFGDTGLWPSLALDSAGFPVISYATSSGFGWEGDGELRLVRCDDDRCAVDPVDLVATVSRAADQPAVTNSTPIRFAVDFGSEVTGFEVGDITVSGTAGATTARVRATNGGHYTVTIDDVPNDGIVKIAVAAGAVTNSSGSESTTFVISDTVTVDRSGPSLEVPEAPIRVVADPGGLNAIATYDVTAFDADTPVVATCDPASGTRFPVGATTVSCLASDHLGNTTTAAFQVIVDAVASNPPAQLPATGTGTWLLVPATSTLAAGMLLLVLGRRRPTT